MLLGGWMGYICRFKSLGLGISREMVFYGSLPVTALITISANVLRVCGVPKVFRSTPPCGVNFANRKHAVS